VVGSLGKRTLHRLARTRLGFRMLSSVASADPQVIVEALGPRVNRGARFSSVRAWPDELRGFEDLAFLFSSHQLHHAIISMAIDEAAYLYRLAHGLREATVVEIGRSKGGSTLLLAAAVGEGSQVYSYDLHLKATAGSDSDRELRDALARYGFAERVTLLVADSRTAEPPPTPCDLVLVDGDHSYAGVRGDYEHWRGTLRPDGHLLFHDAAELGDLSSAHRPVMRLMEEIERDDGEWFRRRGGAGTLLHFERTDAPLR
jgi:predicted O-methyltransferase YrrM